MQQVWNNRRFEWKLAVPVPPVLHACSESRRVALRIVQNTKTDTIFYFRPDIDTLYVRRNSLLPLQAQNDLY